MSYNDQIICGQKASVTTYVEDEILIPPMPRGMLPALLQVEIQFSEAAFDAADDKVAWHLSPKTQDAVLTVGDQEAIAASEIQLCGTLAQGLTVTPFVQIYTLPAPLLLSFTKIYIGMTSTTATTISYRLHWVPRSSKVPQRDNVVSQLQF